MYSMSLVTPNINEDNLLHHWVSVFVLHDVRFPRQNKFVYWSTLSVLFPSVVLRCRSGVKIWLFPPSTVHAGLCVQMHNVFKEKHLHHISFSYRISIWIFVLCGFLDCLFPLWAVILNLVLKFSQKQYIFLMNESLHYFFLMLNTSTVVAAVLLILPCATCGVHLFILSSSWLISHTIVKILLVACLLYRKFTPVQCQLGVCSTSCTLLCHLIGQSRPSSV